jgi:hypothetical protein
LFKSFASLSVWGTKVVLGKVPNSAPDGRAYRGTCIGRNIADRLTAGERGPTMGNFEKNSGGEDQFLRELDAQGILEPWAGFLLLNLRKLFFIESKSKLRSHSFCWRKISCRGVPFFAKRKRGTAHPAGLEPATPGLGISFRPISGNSRQR